MAGLVGRVWNSICGLFSVLIVGLVGPIIFIVFLPIYFIRWAVSILAWCFRPDLGSMLNVRSAFFGPELVDGQESISANLVITYVFQGHLTTETVYGWFINLVKMRTEEGAYKYPELRQFACKWLGFVFWKWDEDWDVKNYVKYISIDPKSGAIVEGPLLESSREIGPNELRDIEREMVKRKYGDKLSPWEFRIIHNYRPKEGKEGVPYSVGLFKVHHGLAGEYFIVENMK